MKLVESHNGKRVRFNETPEQQQNVREETAMKVEEGIGDGSHSQQSQVGTTRSPYSVGSCQVEGRVIKLNPLVFSEKMNPSLCKVKWDQENLIFAVACPEGLKLYSWNCSDSFQKPAKMIFSEYSEKFSNKPRSKSTKEDKRNRQNMDKKGPLVLLEPITRKVHLPASIKYRFLINRNQAKDLSKIWKELEFEDSESFNLEFNYECDELKTRPLPRQKITFLGNNKNILIFHKAIPRATSLKVLGRVRDKMIKIDLKKKMGHQLALGRNRGLGRFLYSQKSISSRYVCEHQGGDTFHDRPFDEEAFWKYRYLYTTQKLLRSPELPGIKYGSPLIPNPDVSHFFTNEDLSLFIITVNTRRRQIVRHLCVDLTQFRSGGFHPNTRIAGFRGFIWDPESDIALVLLVNLNEDVWIKLTNFGFEEKRQYEPLTNLGTSELGRMGLSLKRVRSGDVKWDLEKEVAYFLDHVTGLIKKTCLVHSAVADEIAKFARKGACRITKDSILEELIIDPEIGLSLAMSPSHLYLCDRTEKKVHWKIPYRYEFLGREFIGQRMASYSEKISKVNIFGVCEETKQFDLIKELWLAELGLPKDVIFKTHSQRHQDVLRGTNDQMMLEEVEDSLMELKPSEMINFSYLRNEAKYLLAFLQKAQEFVLPDKPSTITDYEYENSIQSIHRKHRKQLQYLILLKLDSNLDVEAIQAHQYKNER